MLVESERTLASAVSETQTEERVEQPGVVWNKKAVPQPLSVLRGLLVL